MNSNQPLVSVLVATYNSEMYIETAIKSILNQTYQKIEVIIIDDASTDKTYVILNELFSKYSNIHIKENKKNIGYLKTFNRLIKHASGDLITFLDSDDLLNKEKVEKQVDVLKGMPQLSFVGTSYKKIDEKNNQLGIEVLPRTREEIIKAILDNVSLPICGSSLMIRKKVLDEIGGYKDFFVGCPGEDVDWTARILEKFDGINISEPLYEYRFRANSLTRTVFTQVKQRHIRQIISFLIKQRKEHNGKDSLNSELSGLNEFIKELEKPYLVDKGLMSRKMSFDYAVNRDYFNAFKYFLYSLKTIKLSSVKLFVYILILLIFKKSFLLKVMAVFNVKNMSSRL